MAKKTPKKARSRPQRQRDGAPPVIEDPTLPRMGEASGAPLQSGRATLMPDEPKSDTGTRNRMAPLRRAKGSTDTRVPKGGYSDQKPPKPPRRTKVGGTREAKEGYVRLRVLVQDGELSVAGAKFVEGPLAAIDTLHPGSVYEVTLGSRRIAAGVITDAGVWRSFPDPLGRPGLEGHHVTEVPSYEIAVRVPIQELSISTLPKVRITLYRWRGTSPVALVETRSLKTQMKGRVKVITTLNGIRFSRLSKRAQAELREALE